MQMTTIGVARSLSDLDKDYQDAVSSVTEVLFEDDFEIATRENATREKKRCATEVEAIEAMEADGVLTTYCHCCRPFALTFLVISKECITIQDINSERWNGVRRMEDRGGDDDRRNSGASKRTVMKIRAALADTHLHLPPWHDVDSDSSNRTAVSGQLPMSCSFRR